MPGFPPLSPASFPARLLGRVLVWAAISLAVAAMPAAAQLSSPRSSIVPSAETLVQARLVPERAAVAPGSTLWVALDLTIAPGWHVYWRNPGDAGLPTAIDWTLPKGFSAGPIAWPVPERFVASGLANFGYAGKADLLVPVTAPASLDVAGGAVTLAARASWLVCSEICIPGEAALSLPLPVTAGEAMPDPAATALFAAARAALPQPAPFETRFAHEPQAYRLSLPAAATEGLRDPLAATFFPNEGDILDHAAAASVARQGDGIAIALPVPAPAPGPAGASAGHGPDTLDGVLVLAGAGGTPRAYAISANPAPDGVRPIAPEGAATGWAQAILLAFLGGIVLNAMPCVFPILSLKILALASHSRETRRAQLWHGAAYTAGVLTAFAALGGVLLVLRAGGAAIGWGFQLQSPVFVTLLAYLLFAMGLSLSGLVVIGGAGAGMGDRWARQRGALGAFATGVLATIVATPCTAPFMGTALGFALSAPALAAFGILMALGLGLAFPFLLASAVPGVSRLLPRPGPWMESFRQFLAFPLYATVAWLAWVAIQEVDPGSALAVLSGFVAIAFAAWAFGQSRGRNRVGRRIGAVAGVAGTVGAILLAALLMPAPSGNVAAASGAGESGLSYEPFTPARLAALTAEQRPVFVNLTAAWCLTCLVNERAALDRAAVRAAFAQKGVVALKGDWTRQDAAITSFLQGFGRSGVPLYLLYGSDGPQILPQILTEAALLDAVEKLGPRSGSNGGRADTAMRPAGG